MVEVLYLSTIFILDQKNPGHRSPDFFMNTDIYQFWTNGNSAGVDLILAVVI